MLNLDFWYRLTPRVQAACGVLMLVCLAVLLWWGCIRPVVMEKQRLEQQRVAQQAALQQRWHALLALRPPTTIPDDTAPETPFSPLDFQSEGAQLIRWHPAPKGGEMLLEVQWAQVPQTFAHLAERQMLTSAFSLIAQDNTLHLSLQLERDDGE